MSEKKRNIACLILLAIEIALIAVVWYCAKMRIDYDHPDYSRTSVAIAVLLLTAIIIIKKPNVFSSAVLYLMICALMIFAYHNFSALDEAQHFHMIDYISQYHRLPGFNDPYTVERLHQIATNTDEYVANYEAMQTPLYYYLMHFLVLPVKDVVTKFYTVRVITCIFGLVNLFLLNSLLKYAEEKEYIRLGRFRDYLVLCIALAPLYTEIFARVSNDSLMVLVATCIYGVLLKYSADLKSDDGSKDIKYLIVITALSIILFYTKMSAAPVVFSAFVFLLLYKKFKSAAIYTVCTGVACAPWFIMNKIRYNSFTCSNLHLELILPWARPSGEKVTIWEILFRVPDEFITSFTGLSVVNGENYNGSHYLEGLAFVAFFFILSSVVIATVFLVRDIVSAKSVTTLSPANKLLLVSLAAIFAEAILLIYESIASGFDIQNNRAFAPYYIPFAICFAYLQKVISTESRKVLAPTAIVLVALLCSNVFFASAISITNQYMIWPPRSDYSVQKSITVSDISEDTPVSLLADNGKALKKHPLLGAYLVIHVTPQEGSELDPQDPNIIPYVYFQDDNWKYERLYFPSNVLTNDGGILVRIPDDVKSPESATIGLIDPAGVSEITVDYVY